jgi:hypothetical protein
MDHTELIEVQDDQLAIVQSQFQPIKPEPVISAPGEPRTCLDLTKPNDLALDGTGPRAVPQRGLLRHAYAGSNSGRRRMHAHLVES